MQNSTEAQHWCVLKLLSIELKNKNKNKNKQHHSVYQAVCEKGAGFRDCGVHLVHL